MCTDTTAVNTGSKNGACVLLENTHLKRNLLYFPCRHHIAEIVLGAVFVGLFGTSTGPAVPIFQKFKENWSNIQNKTYIEVSITSQLIVFN